MAIAP